MYYHFGTLLNGAKISVFGSDKTVNVTRSIGILPNATNFSKPVSSIYSVLASWNRRACPLGTPTSPSALTTRATFLADADVGAPRAIRWRSRPASGGQDAQCH